MQAESTTIVGSRLLVPQVFEDKRGHFFESYNRDVFHRLGIVDLFVQDNASMSHRGVLRGMHFQRSPREMSKLIRCTRGRVFDVLVDMRPSSPTFKAWYGAELSAANHRMLYVPAGCAHGFYALEACEIVYKCGHQVFSSQDDSGFRWDDPDIAIEWPLRGAPPVLSPRDQELPAFAEQCPTPPASGLSAIPL
ncbi:MAG: dTDP-4-dehydrorhamnose 3,5-epimerase [Nannocystaceae bacterium]